MEKQYDIIILGTDPAGLYALEKKLDEGAKCLLITNGIKNHHHFAQNIFYSIWDADDKMAKKPSVSILNQHLPSFFEVIHEAKASPKESAPFLKNNFSVLNLREHFQNYWKKFSPHIITSFIEEIAHEDSWRVKLANGEEYTSAKIIFTDPLKNFNELYRGTKIVFDPQAREIAASKQFFLLYESTVHLDVQNSFFIPLHDENLKHQGCYGLQVSREKSALLGIVGFLEEDSTNDQTVKIIARIKRSLKKKYKEGWKNFSEKYTSFLPVLSDAADIPLDGELLSQYQLEFIGRGSMHDLSFGKGFMRSYLSVYSASPEQ